MSKLFRIYKLLEKNDEVEVCRSFIESSYHNKSRSDRKYGLLELYNSLDCCQDEYIGDRALSEKAYPEMAFHEKNFTRAKSELMKLIQRYLVTNVDKENDLEKATKYLSVLRITKQFNDFVLAYKKLKLDLEKQNLRNEYYYRCYRLVYEEYARYYTEAYRRHDYDVYVKIENAINYELMCQKLRVACTTFSKKVETTVTIEANEFLLHKFNLAFFQYIEDLSQKDLLPIVVKMYHCCLTMLKEENIIAYQQLKEIIVYNVFSSDILKNIISNLELKELFDLITNFCIRKSNKDNTDLTFVTELNFWYTLGIQHEIILENKILSLAIYKNIVVNYIKLRMYDEANDFINNHHRKLKQEDKQNAELYTIALLCSREGGIDAARKVIIGGFTAGQDHFRIIHHYRIVIKLHFEEGNEQIENEIKNFGAYLERNKSMIDYHYLLNQNFIHTIKEIYQLKIDQNNISSLEISNRKIKLYQKIENHEVISDKEWLMECLRITIKGLTNH